MRAAGTRAGKAARKLVVLPPRSHIIFFTVKTSSVVPLKRHIALYPCSQLTQEEGNKGSLILCNYQMMVPENGFLA